MAEISGSSLLSQVRALQERVRLDMQNGGATQTDYTQLKQVISNANSVLAASPDATDAFMLNTFIDQISGADPFADSVFDTAATSFETGVQLMATYGGGSVFQAKGVPTLSMPISPGDMQIWLSQLMSENAEAQLQGDQSQIQESGAIQKDVNQRALGQFQIEEQNQQNAAQTQQQSGVAGWFAAVFEVIGAALAVAGAVLAAVASGGAAAPLVACAVIGAMMAIDDLANQAVQQAGVQTTGVDGKQEPLDISLGGMVKAIVQQQVKDGTIAVAPETGKPGALVFKDQQALNNYISGWSVAASMLVAVGMVALGGAGGIAMGLKELAEEAGEAASKAALASGATADEAADAAAAAAKEAGSLVKDTVGETLSYAKKAMGSAITHATKLEAVVDIAGAVNDVASGGTQVYQGSLEVKTAQFNNTAAVAKAEMQMLQTISDYLTQYIKTQSTDAQNKAKVIESVQKSASDTLQNIADTLIATAQQDA